MSTDIASENKMNRNHLRVAIFSFLDCFDLAEVQLVNRSFYNTCTDPQLWAKEVLQRFSSENFSPKELKLHHSNNWRLLCLEGVKLPRQWIRCSGPVLTTAECILLATEVAKHLVMPDFVLPKLRHEFHSFPSLMQDMLANPFDQASDDPNVCTYADRLRNILQTSCQKLSEQYLNESFLRQVYDAVRRTLRHFCSVTSELIALETESTVFLDEYLHKWTLYCNSVHSISALLCPLTDLYLAVSGQAISLVELSREVWKELVWNRLKPQLLGAQLEVLWEQRQSIVMSQEYSYEAVSLLSAFTEALCDLNLTRNQLYRKTHSAFLLTDGLVDVHEAVLDASEHFYQSLPLATHDLEQCLEADARLIEASVLPRTSRAVESLRCAVLQTRVYSQIKEYYWQFTMTASTPELSLNCPLGRDLALELGNPKKVSCLLGSLLNSPEAALVGLFNSLACGSKAREDDFLTERKAELVLGQVE